MVWAGSSYIGTSEPVGLTVMGPLTGLAGLARMGRRSPHPKTVYRVSP